MKYPVLLVISLLCFFLCRFDGNMYNPEDPAYIPPSFVIDVSASNVKDGDTILTDTIRLTLIGNDEDRHYNLFRYSLDNLDWSDWKGKGAMEYIIEHTGIIGGTHTLKIEYCYLSQTDDARDSTIVFFRAMKPSIAAMVDTLLDADAGVPCTLWVKAEGTGELSCQWYRDSTKLDSDANDLLILDGVSVEDTVHRWHCRVENNWGDTTSAVIRLRILFRVFYDGNGATRGEVPVDVNRYATDGIVEVPGNPGKITRRGYSFLEWNTKSDGSGNDRDSGDIFKIGTESVTLYAKWHPNDSFTVTYDGNGAEKGALPVLETYYKAGELVAVAGNSGNLERSGFTFTGWNTRADDSAARYVENDTFEMGEANVTLFARWTDKPTFKVTYFANGADSGEVPTDDNEYNEGSTVTVASNSGSLRKKGNTFVGWNTEPEGDDGVFHFPGATFPMGMSHVKLHARWTTKPTYTLTYTGNDNTSGTPPAAIENEAGAEVNIAGQGSLVRKGYSFTAWDTKADTSGKEYRENDVYIISAKHDTLYAQWEVNLYTVTYEGNCNGADKVPKSTTREYNVEFSLSSDIPTCIGHAFNTWKTERGADYDPGAPLRMPDANMTLQADWTVNKYTITYDGNGHCGGNAPDIVTTNYNDSVTITGEGSLEKAGYSFTGWNTKNDGSGTHFRADTVIFMGAGDLTLFALWTVNQYKVTFDCQRGSIVDSQMVNYNDTVITPAAPSKIGFTFKGWYKEAACTTAWVFATDRVAESVTLYAKWTRNSYNVAFLANIDGADGEMTSQTIAYDSTTHLKPNGFRLDGWTFTGWAENSEQAAVVYTDGAAYTMGLGDDTLYGVWRRNRYKVTFNSQGGSAVDSQMVNHNDTARTPAAPARTGFAFGGWYKEAACTSKWSFAEDRVIWNVTLYAKWNVMYTITYHLNEGTNGKNPATYTIESSDIVLVDAERKSYVFDGWHADADFATKVKITTIPKGSTGNRELWAKWVIKDVDGNFYTEVKIGKQVWLVENLKTTRYRDGTVIPRLTDATASTSLSTPGYCWYGNDSATYNAAYGILYNWYAVADAHQLAPAGWHVPTDAEWSTLEAYLGGSGSAGGKLKEAGTLHWQTPNTDATNESRFSALPGGYRSDNGTFLNIGGDGYWWSAKEFDTANAWYRTMLFSTAYLYRSSYSKSVGFSVRCVRD